MARAVFARIAVVAALLLATACAHARERRADETSAAAAAVGFVLLGNAGRLDEPGGRRLLSGELADRHPARFVPAIPPPDRIVAIGRGRAVARIPAGPHGTPDMYLYLEQGAGGWSVAALRSLATTGPIALLAVELLATPNLTAGQQAVLRNAQLTLSSDRDLIAWSQRNRALLEQARRAPQAAETTAALVAAGAVQAVVRDGRVHVVVGGLVDNSVGFLFAGDRPPPRMDRNGFIWIEDAGGGWYLYKTT